MDAGTAPAPQRRVQHRHELRTLTYVTLDQDNGGVVRNLTGDGMGLQVVAPVRPRQQLRARFELRFPRMRVETHAEVIWATFSGQCGVRFLDLNPNLSQQINEWIFGDLLEQVSAHHAEPIFAVGDQADGDESNRDGIVIRETSAEQQEEDGLVVSATPVKVIELPVKKEEPEVLPSFSASEAPELDWLSQPLSGRGLAWTVNALVVLAGMFLVALVFLSVTREAPRWPWALAAGDGLFVALAYWGFFEMFGGSSLGTRLARLMESGEEEEAGARFR
jgi:PilZ domain